MGIDVPALQLLCCAKSMGVDFTDTMMIGRQTINAKPCKLAPFLAAIGIPKSGVIGALSYEGFAEPLYQMLGAKNVRSLDVSTYEQATDIHDMNEPLPPSLSKQFSVVHDGGALEHVFNIVQAFKNAADMVKVGGAFIQINTANNFMGHGFWQFSPELIYRMFSPENGFKIKAVFLRDDSARGHWYQVDDPHLARSRVELRNRKRTYICTIAERIADVPIFARPAQQSDYVIAWDWQSDHKQAKHFSSIRKIIPDPLKKHIGACLWRLRKTITNASGPFNRPYYKKVSLSDMLHGRISGVITRSH